MALILVWGHSVQVLGMGQPCVPGYSVSGHSHDAPAVQGTNRNVHATGHLQVYFRYSTLFMAAGIIHRTVWLPEGIFQVQQCCCATDIIQVRQNLTGCRYISGTSVWLAAGIIQILRHLANYRYNLVTAHSCHLQVFSTFRK